MAEAFGAMSYIYKVKIPLPRLGLLLWLIMITVVLQTNTLICAIFIIFGFSPIIGGFTYNMAVALGTRNKIYKVNIPLSRLGLLLCGSLLVVLRKILANDDHYSTSRKYMSLRDFS